MVVERKLNAIFGLIVLPLVISCGNTSKPVKEDDFSKYDAARTVDSIYEPYFVRLDSLDEVEQKKAKENEK